MLDLVEAGKPSAGIAASLGVPDQTVYNWPTQDRIDRCLQPDATTVESVELALLKERTDLRAVEVVAPS